MPRKTPTTPIAEPTAGKDVKTVVASSPVPEPVKTPEPEKEEQPQELQPATFSKQGLTMRCDVCGTEARQDLDQNLTCPNAHNHPPLITEPADS